MKFSEILVLLFINIVLVGVIVLSRLFEIVLNYIAIKKVLNYNKNYKTPSKKAVKDRQ